MVNRTPPRSKPQHDVSGEYVLNRQASSLSPAAAAGVLSASVRIEHHEPHFRYHFAFVVDGKPFEGAFELITDGREVTHMERGRLSVSTLRWDGDALVSTDRSEGTITFRYELLDAGHRLRVAEQIRGTNHDRENLRIFERR